MPEHIDGATNLPVSIRRAIWSIAHPYAEIRIWLRDAPFLPGWLRPFLRGSVRIGAVLDWAIGPDPRIPHEDTE